MHRRFTILLVAGLVGAALAQGPNFGEAPRHGMTARMEVQQADLRQQAEAQQRAEAPSERHGPSHLGAHMRGALHDALGLPEAEIHERKEAGASIASIAADEGIELDVLEKAFLAARAAAIAELLEQATIGEVQAERMQARGPEVFASVVEREGPGGGLHDTGVTRAAHRTDEPRGPQAAEQVRSDEATQQRRGPHWEQAD